MSNWGTNGNANRIKDTYIKGFLDISGGTLIVEKTSSLQIMAHDSDHPVLEFKPEYFTVNTTSSVDISYSSLAVLGVLGVSFEQSTADITGRIKYITTGTSGAPPNEVFYTEIGNDDERSQLQVYGLIKGHYGLEVDGDVSFNNQFFVMGDSSFNGNLSVGSALSVGGDLSLNGNLYVAKRSVFTLDVSMNQNVDIGSGSNSVSINKDISSAFALDVSGTTMLRNNLFVLSDVSFGTKMFVSGDSSLNGNLSVGQDLSLNGNLYVVKRAVFTADVSMNGNVKHGSSVSINKDISSAFALDVSGITNLRNNLFVLSDVSFGTKMFVSGDSSFNSNLSVGQDLSLNGNLYVAKRSVFTADVSMNGNVKHGSSVSINKDISSAFALDVSGITNLRNNLFVLSDVSFGTKMFVSGDSSFNSNLSVGNDLSLNGNLYVVKRSIFTGDVSMNGNVKHGSSVSINKDISSAYALDVSGITNLRNNLFVLSDVSFGTKMFVSGDSSFNGNLSVGNDLSLNGNLYVVKRSVFTADVSMNGNVKHGSSVSINKDISSAFALDVSGITNLRNNLFVLSDVSFGTKMFVSGDSSFNSNLSVGNDLSLNGNLYVVKRSVFTADVSMNGNVKLGSGLQSVAVNKDISSAFALDVSGITNLRNNLFVLSDVSFGTKMFVSGDSSFNSNLSVGNDLSLNGNLYVVKRSVFTADVSMNGNVKLGSGFQSVAVNKDISSAYALDVSGLTILRNTLYVASDVSLNGNLYVNTDLSLNGNLYVVKRSIFTADVSMNGNVKLGSGLQSVAVNKDISSAYALDVSGLTILRNTLYVASDVSLNGNLSVANITEPNPAGNCNLWTNSTGGNIFIGNQSSTGLYLKGTVIDIQGGSGLAMTINTTGTIAITNSAAATAGFITGNKTVDVNIGTGNFTTTNGIMNIFTGSDNDANSKLNIGTGQNNAGEINISTGTSRPLTSNTNIGGTVNLGSATSKTSVLGIMNVTNDASLNGNVKLGSGSRSVAINKDISAGYALDVSGLVILRNTMYVASDLSLNANLFVNRDSSFNGNLLVGGDLSLNSNLYVVKRALFSSDVSINGNVKLGSGSRSVAINKDISAGYALDVSGLVILRNTMYIASDLSLNANLFVNRDSSFNGNLLVGGDLSLNSNLYVVKRALFSSDVSMLGNLDIGSGSSCLAINKDISAGYALDVSGLVILRNTMYVASDLSLNANLFVNRDSSFNGNLLVGGDLSLNSNLYVVKRALFSSDVSINGNVKMGSGSRSVAINKDISAGYALDVSGLVILRNTMYVTSDLSLGANLFVNRDSSFNGNLLVGGDLSLNSNLYVVKRALFSSDVSINGNVKMGSGSRTVAINKDISAGYALDVSGLVILRNTMYVTSDLSLGANLFVNTDSSFNGKVSVGGDLSLNSNLYVVKRALFSSDVSMLGNLDIGSGSSFLAINKDISAGYALDVSGATILRNTLYTGSIDTDISSGQIYLYDSLRHGTGNLYINNNSSSSATTRIGGGSIFVAGSGVTYLRSATTQPVRIGDNITAGGTVNLGTAASKILVFGDASFNRNVKLGSGTNSVVINKDVSAGYALDVSGLVILRNTMYVASDLSLNANLFVNSDSSFNGNLSVGGDLSLNSNLYVVKRSVFTLDVSMNGNLDIGSGSSFVSINKDISAGYALDVSGITNLRNNLFILSDVSFGTKLFVSGDSSFNSNLSVGNDLSLNGNLYVAKRSVFTLDVSMLGNLDVGSGSSSFAVNKDISAGFALDVSGRSQIRGNLDVAGVFTVNGAPVSGGGTLTGNVQVGSNSGFVTIDKPQFYADPSLIIFYNFDTSYNTTRIQNMTNISGLYDGSMNGITTGLTIIDQNNPKFGTASLRNTPGSGGKGISIGPINTAIPVSSTMTFSVWVRKPNNPVSPDWDRIFEFSDYTTIGGVPGQQNNTIALDISADGFVYPKLTYNGPSNNSCFTTLSSPIFSYNLCNGIWNHILWVINANKSFIYINGALAQNDNITNFPATTTRASGFIAYSYVFGDVTYGNDFSGNIDDFRYYKDKALTYAEIYQLYNNSFYTLDICGGFLANGSSVIYEPTGTPATANSGSLTLLHGDAGGSSSIVFKSAGGQGDYAYIDYDDSNYIVQSILKYDLSNNIPTTLTHATTAVTVPSTGTEGNALQFLPIDNSFVWISPTQYTLGAINGVTPAYCISFNQTNLLMSQNTYNVPRINYLNHTGIPNTSSFTISAWIRPTGLTYIQSEYGRYCVFHTVWAATSNMVVVQMYLEISATSSTVNAGKLFVLINNDGTNYQSTSIALTQDTWWHVAFVYNSNTLNGQLYLNGSTTNITTLGSGYTGKTVNHSSVFWGYMYNASSSYTDKGFRGQMAFINLFDLPLTASDLKYLYDNPGYSSSTSERGLMTIGIESETGYINGDRISLFPSNGSGFVGVNTKNPITTLDISGQMRIYEGVGTRASGSSGSLTLEHATTGGVSSLVFKASSSSTTSDYAYVQYEDNYTTNILPLYEWDLSTNVPTTWSNTATFASTGLVTTALTIAPTDSSLSWVATSLLPTNRPTNFGTYCISFNQTNVTPTGTSRINYLQTSVTYSNNFSISLWVYPTLNSITNKWITIASLSAGVAGFCAEITIDGNSPNNFVVLFNDSDSTGFQLNALSIATINRWHHLVLTYNDSTNTAKIYVNGTNTASLTLASVNQFSNLVLGMRWGNNTGANTTIGAKGFRGAMCFVNMFNEEITSAHVTSLYTDPTLNLTSTNSGLMTIGIENDSQYTARDSIVLWPNGGTGFVGINTKTPQSTLDVSGQIQASSYNATSDYRTKDNVMKLDTTFTVDGLNPVTYQFKPTGKQDVGFLAHEVQELYPFLVNGVKDGPNNQSLNYNGFIGILTKEIKDLKKKVLCMETKALEQSAKALEQSAKALEQSAKALEQSAKALEQDARIQALEQSAKALEKLVSDLINK